MVEPTAWISNVEPGFHPEGELLWHCDYAFTPHPMLGLSLYAIELAEGAAPTGFASNARALVQLPPDVRAQLEALRVVHVIDSVSGRDNVRTRLEDVGGEAASKVFYPRFARPAIWRHPVTGRPLLFVLGQQASHFEDFPRPRAMRCSTPRFGSSTTPRTSTSTNGGSVTWSSGTTC